MVPLPCFENEVGRRMVVLFAGLILVCLARCGFCGGGTVRYLYTSFTSVRMLLFRCAALYEALTDISHLAADSQERCVTDLQEDICLQQSFVFPFHYIFTPRNFSIFLFFFNILASEFYI
jgi:hypothetical protein